MAYAAAMKVYTGFSARRFNCDVQAAYRQGITNAAPSFNSVNRYIADPDMTPIITDMIERSAAPLSVVESQFAADSSGFSTCRFDRWFDVKWGKERSKRQWLKAHIVVGTKTNIITAVKVTQSDVHDSPVLPRFWTSRPSGLTWRGVRRQSPICRMPTWSTSRRLAPGPYIPFKSNTTARAPRCGSASTPTSS